MKIYGIIPARMSASRFYGKPLHDILGVPMLEHVFIRSKMYGQWDELIIATCDDEIVNFCKKKGFPVVMTSSNHTRALDRVAEASNKLSQPVLENDLVVCVQGDEPMLEPEMIQAVIDPILSNDKIQCTVLAMHIVEKDLWLNPDTVKIIHNEKGKVLYTSRAPIPYVKKEFSEDLMARRIYGIFAFKKNYLDLFIDHTETRLEQLEACDSNRILDMDYDQYIAPYPNRKSYSVDSPDDIKIVEKYMVNDECYKKY